MRAATVADAPALAALHAACFDAGDAWGAPAIATMLELPGAYGFWVPARGLVLASIAADTAEILTLGVVPAARLRGVASALLAAAMAGALQRGATAMFLEVASENPAARGLYAAAGFVRVGRRRRYYRGGGDALVLRSDLAQAQP